MKAINYKLKKLKRLVFFFHRKPLRPVIIQNISCVQKYSKERQKAIIKLLFFVKRKVSKFIKNSLKTLDFMKQILLTPSPDNIIVIFGL